MTIIFDSSLSVINDMQSMFQKYDGWKANQLNNYKFVCLLLVVKLRYFLWLCSWKKLSHF